MKNALIFSIQLLLLVLPLTTALADFSEPHITVYGTAEIEVVPDKIIWALSVKNHSETVKEAADRHAEEVSKVLTFLYDSGIARENVATSRIHLQENYVYRNNSRLKDGYIALTSINFETTDFTTYLNYWKSLANFKNLTISGVDFDITNRNEIQDELRITAAKNARKKASGLAKAMGTRIIEPLLIEETATSSILQRDTAMVMEASGTSRGSSPISPGKEILQAQIKAIFRITTAEP